MRSLEWGFTDGSLSEAEALSLAIDIREPGDDLLEELVEAKLIFELQNVGGAIRIRSRFAELVRLLVANRQLFPGRPWQAAPGLVADFRVDRRARRFPRRDRNPAEILKTHAHTLGSTALRTALWQALTATAGLQLAAFQERSAARLATPPTDGGTIITAGTGSGKTIAFYLPAMLGVGEAIDKNDWVKAIAIYPRIELLKDQFAEAFRMARIMDAALAAHGRRGVRIGALFGATPRIANRDELAKRNWLRRGMDFICPWMRCTACDGELVWREGDLNAKRERLTCVRHDCAKTVSEEHIVLTRLRLQQHPPDILFTTTEILNQRLSDHWMRGIFGVGAPPGRKPFLALLDEVHTYEGAAGAQVALTLRRWRHLLAAPISWVGLSATLGEADRFFADLTGVHQGNVVEITPSPDEYVEEGAEYQLLLRSDPASGASVLSTTIQTAMLVPRVLDPPGTEDASGAFGRRAFLFTDDLDVTNRLFDDLRDAEAYTIFGKIDPQRLPLASLRGSGPDAAIRDVEGQRWRICEFIGHPPDSRLIVGRTTSQDAGVNQVANIVVATAALEVGFNDPHVGAVIQHKAPRGMASFLQRKGRAGRPRAMRPITLTVLSDYGRDRAFYQAYEHLFDPSVAPQYLPIRNPYVLKIQATFALFDWLASRSSGLEKAWMWDILSRPTTRASSEVERVIGSVKKLLGELVQGDENTISDFRSYLASALCMTDAGVQALLWEAPRSLLLEAVPTLVRRLFRQWRLAFPATDAARDLQVDHHPLPDFVPRSLFSDLSLPEVRAIIPPATTNHAERLETMPILQALNQLVPGRVTRRFAHERGALSHWVPVDPALPQQTVRIGDYAEEHEFVGMFRSTCNDHLDDDAVMVFRPWTIRVAKVTRAQALPSSNARLAWRTDIVANGNPLKVAAPPRSQWRAYLQGIDFYLHRFRSSVSVRRFAPVANANVRTLQDDFSVSIHFRSETDQPAAVGFEIEVDGFRMDLILPPAETLAAKDLPPVLSNACRTAYLRDLFIMDAEMPEDLNKFQRDWIFQLLCSVLFANAAATNRPLDTVAHDVLHPDRIEDHFRDAMTDLFGAIPPHLSDEDETDTADAPEAGENDNPSSGPGRSGPSRLQQAIAAHLGRPIVQARLRVLAAEFVAPGLQAFGTWLRRMIMGTVGEAMLQACIAVAPRQATVDTLLVDMRDDQIAGSGASIWVTESTLGGAGVLQAFAERFTAEPRIFFTALESALAPTDLEMVDTGLREILALAQTDADVTAHLALMRATSSHYERAALWQGFSGMLAKRGSIDLSHALSVSLNKRLLRAGSGPELDSLLFDLQANWDQLEQTFALSIGLREFAYIASKNTELANRTRAFLAATLPAAAAMHVTVLATITSLLWPREGELRQRVLQSHNPYREGRTSDPGVARHLLLTRPVVTIELSDPDWFGQFRAAIETHGTCRLAVDMTFASVLRNAVVQLVATPCDVGFLQFFPVVEGVERTAGRIFLILALREQV
jgi:hypothetical protein